MHRRNSKVPIISLLCWALVLLSQETFGERSLGADYEYMEYDYDKDTTPMFLARSQTFTVEVGQSVIIPCDVQNAGQHKLTIKRIPKEGGKEMIMALAGVKVALARGIQVQGNSLHITHVLPRDAGTYICTFLTVDNVELRHFLNVQFAPSVKASVPPEQRVTKGSSVTLKCEADGNPKPKIRWSRKQGPLPSGAKTEEGESLTLEEVDRHVEGEYYCTADNGIGEPSTASLEVVVEYPPEITTEKAIVRTGEGDTVELVCLVRGRPDPHVSWTRDGQQVMHDSHVTVTEEAHRHTLRIKNVKEKDFGAYVCIAENTQGQQSSVVQMTGLPKQPHFTSDPLGGENHMYTLKWETESYYPVMEYRLMYRVTQPNHSSSVPSAWEDILRKVTDEVQTRGTSHYIALPLTGLRVATDYEAVVRIKNKYGWSSDSDRFEFSTRKAALAVHQATGLAPSTSLAPCLFSLLVAIMLWRI